MNINKILLLIGIIINLYLIYNIKFIRDINGTKKFIKDFDYVNYQNDFITNKMKKYSGWMYMSPSQYSLINGIIRKHKPINCLEVGVASGGSSILILNAIKDLKNSRLVSLDLNQHLYINNNYSTGYRVNKYFPELTDKWQLFTGEQPHIFLQKLNIKYDFVFLDTAHISPGEIINLIEILPFLKNNSIIVLHDIIWHFIKEIGNEKIQSVSSPQILLMSALHGDKILIQNDKGIDNMGAIFLYPNQREYYLDYFLLLLTFWQYMPTEKQLNEIRIFIKKYYQNELYLKIFDIAVINNRNYVNKVSNCLNNN